MIDEEAVQRLTSLRQFQADGRRAPYKPLLVLLALSELQTKGSSALPWSDVENRLGELLREFGPSGRTGTSAAYPFTRLRADGIWELSRDVPDDNLGPLREAPIEGRFPADLEVSLAASPDTVVAAARALVDQQFPLTLAPDVLTAVGFDPDVVFGTPQLPSRNASQRTRSPGWRAKVLTAWDGACAFCGFDGRLGGAPVGLEAAHVRWFNFEGPDDLDNGLSLCALHHKLFDRGALGLRSPEEVMVSEGFNASTEIGRRTYDLHGYRLNPRPGTLLPGEGHVEWHRTEVFKGAPIPA